MGTMMDTENLTRPHWFYWSMKPRVIYRWFCSSVVGAGFQTTDISPFAKTYEVR